MILLFCGSYSHEPASRTCLVSTATTHVSESQKAWRKLWKREPISCGSKINAVFITKGNEQTNKWQVHKGPSQETEFMFNTCGCKRQITYLIVQELNKLDVSE